MTGAGRYAELAAAVRSFKAELIHPSQIERLAEAGSLSEIANLLTGGRVTTAETSDLTSVEAYLIQNVIEVTQRLTAYAPQDSRSLLKLFALSYEFSCVKDILKAVASQTEPEEAIRYIVPAGRFTQERCKELIESRNPTRAVEMINDEILSRFIAPKLAADRSGMLSATAIDQYYFSRLWSASNLPDPLDAQSARGLIGEVIDYLNILLAFRARLIELDARATSEMMIPVNYALGHAFTELVEAQNVQGLVRVLDKTPYAHFLESPGRVEEAAVSVERALKRNHAKSCLNAFAGSPFNVGLALAFLFLKNYELQDLFSIINGKANNLPSEQMLESLILQYH
jgi:vacuolar-type H+-ATPase subunit C/Vma6